MVTLRLAVLALVFVVSSIFGKGQEGALHITSVSAAKQNNDLRVVIAANTTIEAFQKPERSGKVIVLRIPNADIDLHAVQPSCAAAGITVRTERIRNILVLRCTTTVPGEPRLERSGPTSLVLTLGPQGSHNGSPEKSTDTWDLDVIVIDAGHGGVDVGAEGVNGVYEKNITLSIAKRLRDKIHKTFPATKVVLTRDDDTFIELYRRTQIANEANGKLFISIHCNSMPTKPHKARGCETYILRPGRNDDAARVAARENASVKFESSTSRYAKLDEEQLIVATLAQRSFVRFSERLATSIQREVSKGTGLKDRGVSQAGFYVLVGASMPNILFETAFLSNEEDARYISSAEGQEAVADAMVRSLSTYSREWKRSSGR